MGSLEQPVPDGQKQVEIPCISLEQLPTPGSAHDQCGEALSASLDAAFSLGGPGVICIRGGHDFQQQVNRIRADLLPLAWALDHLPEQSKEAIHERGTLNVNNYSRGVDGNRSGIYFHPATDTPADCLPEGIPAEPNFYSPNLWPDEAAPFL
eukprot:CAMPEP_0197673024 /NCGR_PEP_ID=MMETSP1338-20131121/80206_1 /TAXON_ID=43686 ORGANISM="Pelagodinium beii, Strain RCC1491" /NCGR_SAMPLE_ID=MMETSP1338 /ASSEMBLY_ACC=CAM_ASM_000754 /LENGTH=151 /DNA_ID=CAMNT_0043253223 /DNA_START=38 /DNA_END=490 /DNA_ORIENTATION=-